MMSRRRRRGFMGIAMPGSKKSRRSRRKSGAPIAKLAGATAATAAVAAAVPAAQKAAQAMGRGRELVGEASGVIDTAHNFQEAVSSHSSTVGKVGAVISEARKLGGKSGSGSKPKLSHLIEEHTDIAVPRSVAYNQWTQLELFPSIVKGIESVKQDEDDKATWTSKIGPSRRTWTGKIVEQVPDERIVWKSEGGPQLQGVISFHQLDEDLTRVLVQIEYKPKGAVETVGNTLRIQRRRVRRDLRLFKHFVELRGEPTGEWRGQISADGDRLQPEFAGQGGSKGAQSRSGTGNGRGPGSRRSASDGNQRSGQREGAGQRGRAGQRSPSRVAASRKTARTSSSPTSRAGAARQKDSSNSGSSRGGGSGVRNSQGSSSRKSPGRTQRSQTSQGSSSRSSQRSSNSASSRGSKSPGRTQKAQKTQKKASAQKRPAGRSSR